MRGGDLSCSIRISLAVGTIEDLIVWRNTK
jgi:hypothetical protein